MPWDAADTHKAQTPNFHLGAIPDDESSRISNRGSSRGRTKSFSRSLETLSADLIERARDGEDISNPTCALSAAQMHTRAHTKERVQSPRMKVTGLVEEPTRRVRGTAASRRFGHKYLSRPAGPLLRPYDTSPRGGAEDGGEGGSSVFEDSVALEKERLTQYGRIVDGVAASSDEEGAQDAAKVVEHQAFESSHTGARAGVPSAAQVGAARKVSEEDIQRMGRDELLAACGLDANWKFDIDPQRLEDEVEALHVLEAVDAVCRAHGRLVRRDSYSIPEGLKVDELNADQKTPGLRCQGRATAKQAPPLPAASSQQAFSPAVQTSAPTQLVRSGMPLATLWSPPGNRSGTWLGDYLACQCPPSVRVLDECL